MNAHAALERRYGQLKAISRTGNRKRVKRVQFEENGRTVRCVIKTSRTAEESLLGAVPIGLLERGSLKSELNVVIVAPTELHERRTSWSACSIQTTLQNAFEG